MAKVKKSEVVAAIRELNKELGLDPQIKVEKKTLAELKEDALEGFKFVEEEDELSEETTETLEAVSAELEPEEEPTEPETEDFGTKEKEAEGTGEEMESEEAEVGEQVEAEVEAATATVKKETKVTKPTKKAIIEAQLEEGATVEQMMDEIEKAGLDDDRDKNYRVVRQWLYKMGFDTKKSSIEKDPIFKKGKEKE